MNIDIIRAWKDEAYRQTLASEEQEMVPENPAGAFELTDTHLGGIYGGGGCDDEESYSAINTHALICAQSVLVFCVTINGNCGIN